MPELPLSLFSDTDVSRAVMSCDALAMRYESSLDVDEEVRDIAVMAAVCPEIV